MPGLHLIFSPTHLEQVRGRLAPFSAVQHDPAYRHERLLADSSLELHATRYPEYPIAGVAHDQYTIVIEGRIAPPNFVVPDSALAELAGLMFDGPEPDRRRMVDWLMARDGEFVVFIRHLATGSWGLVTDLLGRLPLYQLMGAGNDCIVTRELSHFVHRGAGITPDRMGIAQQLLLGFPSGKRTLLSGVERVPPAALIWWSAAERKLRSEHLHTFRFDSATSGTRLADHAEELAASFVSACHRSAEGITGAAVLSLSGGMDSRSVAAGLRRAGVPFSAYTFVDPFGSAERDRLRASELARALRLEWESVSLLPATGLDIAHLLATKPGQLNPMQAIDRQFLQYLLSRHDRSLRYYSGDGGDALLPCLRPEGSLRSAAAAVDAIIARYAQAELTIIAELTQVSPSDLRAELEAMIAAYPEEQMADRYVHYMICEREIKWSFEGEDRNRGFFWTAAPFLALSFFGKAMAVPSEMKRRHILYREFLVRLSREAADVPDAARGVAITAPAFKRQLIIASWLARWPRAARTIRAWRSPGRRYASSAALVRCLRAQLLGSESGRTPFDSRVVRMLLERPEHQSSEFLENLLAVSAAVEKLSGSSDTLADFRAYEFR